MDWKGLGGFIRPPYTAGPIVLISGIMEPVYIGWMTD